jgi:hypothetical protein
VQRARPLLFVVAHSGRQLLARSYFPLELAVACEAPICTLLQKFIYLMSNITFLAAGSRRRALCVRSASKGLVGARRLTATLTLLRLCSTGGVVGGSGSKNMFNTIG